MSNEQWLKQYGYVLKECYYCDTLLSTLECNSKYVVLTCNSCTQYRNNIIKWRCIKYLSIYLCIQLASVLLLIVTESHPLAISLVIGVLIFVLAIALTACLATIDDNTILVHQERIDK